MSAPRLSVDDWITAGYALLGDEGLGALKIDRLCTRLGVTKGSFYWHFADIAAYRTALIDAWAQQRGEEHQTYRHIAEMAPRERLSKMIATLVTPQHWKLERVMREWARTDDNVARSVEAADRRVVHMVQQAFTDLGFATADAELRARTTFAAGIGFLQIAGARPHPLTAAQRRRFLDLMVRP